MTLKSSLFLGTVLLSSPSIYLRSYCCLLYELQHSGELQHPVFTSGSDSCNCAHSQGFWRERYLLKQVEQARAGIDALADSQEKIGNLRENFELIDRYVTVTMLHLIIRSLATEVLCSIVKQRESLKDGLFKNSLTVWVLTLGRICRTEILSSLLSQAICVCKQQSANYSNHHDLWASRLADRFFQEKLWGRDLRSGVMVCIWGLDGKTGYVENARHLLSTMIKLSFWAMPATTWTWLWR